LTVPAGVALYEKDDTDLAAATASKTILNSVLISIALEEQRTIKMKSVFMFIGENSFVSNQHAVPKISFCTSGIYEVRDAIN